ncbi:MAG TPA: GNAT family N-acetyltransferase [Ramlibacter sp.]|jgi:ribosomal protein S18 acetylase RimI-like enzyme|nr:GNAT family N-acetyltransferase [Ramlibacter sp.]
MPSFTIVDANQVEAPHLHATFTAAFADYLIGPFALPLAQWPQFLARQGVDLAHSKVAVDAGEPVAFCLTAPRPELESWRLGTMGALPSVRGSGAARQLLDDFLARARAAGVGTVELECFAQNARALRLYQSFGFREVDALYGYEHVGAEGDGPSATPTQVDLPDAFDWLDACSDAGFPLPLQVTPRSLRALPVQLQAWRLGSAQLVFSQADAAVQVHSLVDREPAQQDARELAGQLLAHAPGASIHVPQLQRHGVGGAALERAGFERLPLHQLWMRQSI